MMPCLQWAFSPYPRHILLCILLCAYAYPFQLYSGGAKCKNLIFFAENSLLLNVKKKHISIVFI